MELPGRLRGIFATHFDLVFFIPLLDFGFCGPLYFTRFNVKVFAETRVVYLCMINWFEIFSLASIDARYLPLSKRVMI